VARVSQPVSARTAAGRQRGISKEALRAEVCDWARRIKVRPRRVQVQAMRAKWASCSTRGTITLSLDLLAEPQPFREVVVVHELVHLLVPNHGRVFKALMKAYLPDWERRAAGRVSRSCGFEQPDRSRGRARRVLT
jgi:predicted metal-dependent hydrolase